jgi:hypothetical protein
VARTSLETVRSVFGALDARVLLSPLWRGAELERLLDTEHARLVAEVARRLEALGWEVALEVTYSEYGERGSIDVLGLRPGARAVVVVEVKTEIPSAEAMGRKLDEKARLAPAIVRKRYGWTPIALCQVVVMPESMRLRRLVDRSAVIGRMFPAKPRRIRAWLRRPHGSLAGTWFLSISATVIHEATAGGLAGRRSVPRTWVRRTGRWRGSAPAAFCLRSRAVMNERLMAWLPAPDLRG